MVLQKVPEFIIIRLKKDEEVKKNNENNFIKFSTFLEVTKTNKFV